MQTVDKINVCLACDDNYSKYAGVVIASILSSANLNDKLSFYILDGGITDENKNKILQLKNIKNCEINFIKIDNNSFNEYKKIQTHKYITLPACYRLKISSLLPNVDKIIYFDCDIVVRSSLSRLYNIDLGNYPIAGVRDINKRKLKKNPNYVNSGVLLFNLQNMRIEHIEEILLNYTVNNLSNIKTGDQQIINEALLGKIKIIQDEWNVQSSNFTNRSSYSNNPLIIHYVADKKPWHFASFSYHRDLYFKYLQMTPWRLNNEELKHWTVDNKKASIIEYLKYRPLFFLRPRFYKAFYYTYIHKFFEYKKPIIKNNTFLLWEPCSKSHSEVLPGYAKYLLDLGYNVSVLLTPDRIKEGLFCRFNKEIKEGRLFLNKMTQKQIKRFFKYDSLDFVEGVLVTTVGKLCDEIDFNQAYSYFNSCVDINKLHFVAHEAKHAGDNNSWNENLITLRKLNYKNLNSVVVNPHYFGNIKYLDKNQALTNFVMVGAIKSYKKNDNTIIQAVNELDKKGIKNFKVTVIGKGHIKNIPNNLRKYFDIKGRLPFKKMYDELEKADFLLTAYDENNEQHLRYNTTGTSGNFQLAYGFLIPTIIIESFAKINGFDELNSIPYKKNQDYSKAMEIAINMSLKQYQIMQSNLKEYVDKLYINSKNNLENLID